MMGVDEEVGKGREGEGEKESRWRVAAWKEGEKEVKRKSNVLTHGKCPTTVYL